MIGMETVICLRQDAKGLLSSRILSILVISAGEESSCIEESNASLWVSSGIEIQIFCLMQPSTGVSK